VAETHFTHLIEGLIATIASDLTASLRISLPSLLSLTNSGEWLLMRLSLLVLDLMIITSFIIFILFLVSGVHLWGSRSIGWGSGLLVVNLVNWEIHVLLTLVGSSNFGSIHVEDWVSFGIFVFDLTECLIERILGEGALSPHRGNGRLVSRRSVPFKFMEFVRFIHPVMGMSMRMRLRLLLRRRAHLILLITSYHGGRCFCCWLVGLLAEDTLETFFVPNEGIVNLSGLSEHESIDVA
jgi:hypothetical protein